MTSQGNKSYLIWPANFPLKLECKTSYKQGTIKVGKQNLHSRGHNYEVKELKNLGLKIKRFLLNQQSRKDFS